MNDHARLPPTADGQQADRAEQLLAQLDARIAQLALALDLPLLSPQHLAEALHGPSVPAMLQGSTASRQAGLRTVLRGLLTLRYELVARWAQAIGPDETAALIAHAELQLRAHGFQPGADGLDLEALAGRR